MRKFGYFHLWCLFLGCIFVAVMAAAVLSCAGQTPSPDNSSVVQEQKSARTIELETLLAGKSAYDKAFTALEILNIQGKLDEKTKKAAMKYGNLYLDAHNAAVQALLDNKQPNMKMVSDALDNFMKAQAGIK